MAHRPDCQCQHSAMHAAEPLACALLALLSMLPPSETAVAGTFFWKPRVSLDIGQLPTRKAGHKWTIDNIRNGLVVVIDGYQLGLTVTALAGYMQDLHGAYPHLHPGMAPYYTNAYRWALRHLSLLPAWFQGRGSNYVATHKVWRKRYFYMDSFVPQWLRDILFFVDDKSWKHEEWEWNKFKKHAEPHFGKYYRYPSKHFNDYNSMRQDITVENMDASDNSITKGKG